MKLFINKILKYLLLVLLIWSAHVFFLVLIIFFKPTKYDLFNEAKKLDDFSIPIMGNSHPECAVNDSLLKKRYLNISKSGEPLFYTCIKAQNIINQINPDTIVIEFENSALNTIHWVLADDRLVENYRKYFSLMDLSDHYFLFKHNFKKALKGFLFLKLEDVLRYKIVDGNYLFLERNEVISLKLKKVIEKKNKSEEISYSNSVQEKNIQSLFKLIAMNRKTIFIITRMPLHHTFNDKKEDLYKNYVDSFKTFQNVFYIDFNRIVSLPDSCFGDMTHLNYKGARVFTPFFKSYIENYSK